MDVNRINHVEHGQAYLSEQRISHSGLEHNRAAFGDVLQGKVNDSLNFSKHAAKRLDERGISIDNRLMNDLENAVEGARRKGAKDVAVIGSKGVFIVNVPNNVVVTTMAQEDMKERVFTNIDSAVLM